MKRNVQFKLTVVFNMNANDSDDSNNYKVTAAISFKASKDVTISLQVQNTGLVS